MVESFRRLYLDLIGIPPTATELNTWLNDASPDRFERKVDELLARPEYGQRWGRHWMDVWRYSDWYGSRAINEIRYSQRHIWRWRDWIVDSLNTDKPYDRMITEMLAATDGGDVVAGGSADWTRRSTLAPRANPHPSCAEHAAAGGVLPSYGLAHGSHGGAARTVGDV